METYLLLFSRELFVTDATSQLAGWCSNHPGSWTLMKTISSSQGWGPTIRIHWEPQNIGSLCNIKENILVLIYSFTTTFIAMSCSSLIFHHCRKYTPWAVPQVQGMLHSLYGKAVVGPKFQKSVRGGRQSSWWGLEGYTAMCPACDEQKEGWDGYEVTNTDKFSWQRKDASNVFTYKAEVIAGKNNRLGNHS